MLSETIHLTGITMTGRQHSVNIYFKSTYKKQNIQLVEECGVP